MSARVTSCVLFVALAAGVGAAPAPAPESQPPQRARCLLAAYPEHLCDATADHLVWCDGTRMPWHDGQRATTHAERLAQPDLIDQLEQTYPAGRGHEPPGVDFDPGRIRFDPFFKKMYGADKAAVRTHIVKQPWMSQHGGEPLKVTTVNRVHEHLTAVAKELEGLAVEARTLAVKHSGAFNWRRISGTERLSAHSYGIAVDVAVKRSDYWRWGKPGADGRLRWRNRVPLGIVDAFERHGFIWCGRWYHYDTMHFEYRPELLQPPCVSRGASP